MRTRKVNKQQRRNSWYLVYRPPGSSKQVWEPVGNDEFEAERRRKEKEAELMDPDYIEPTRDSFKSLAEEWWSTVAVGKYAESTLSDYRSILDCHLIPQFGTEPASKIRYRRIQKWVTAKQAEISNKRIRNLLNVMSDVYNYGVKAELVRDNPVDKVDRPPIEKEEVRILEPDELWLLFDTVREIQPHYAPLVITAVMTGMRLGELRALTWETVSFERNEIRVRSSQSRKQVKGPKTSAGWRSIPMSSIVREILLERHESRIPGCDLVFPSQRLTPFDPANIRKRVLYEALDQAKLPRVTWHSLRHSAASLMAKAHASDKEVQVIMGHSSIQVTKDLYTHLFEDAKVEAIERMTEFMASKKPEKAEEEQAVYVAFSLPAPCPKEAFRESAA